MNFVLFIYLLFIIPKIFCDRFLKGKKHPGLLQRLGFRLPKVRHPVIWMHAISVGEVKGMRSFFLEMRKAFPTHFFLITTCTRTGQEEAKRSLSEADAFAYFPLDFSWTAQRWAQAIRPQFFILMETDFWIQILRALKGQGTKILLISGKISDRSAKRLAYCKPFARRLFSSFDLLCVQNNEFAKRFFPFIVDKTRIQITGNLKWDAQPEAVDREYWKSTFRLSHPVVAISCTHAPEERLLVQALSHLRLSIILAPRHPERVTDVAIWLQKEGIPFSLFSQHKSEARVLLVDQMGVLPICYTLSHLCILGGSFVDGVGGHNLLEPCQYGLPVFFGPFAYMQKEISEKVLSADAGAVCTPENIADLVRGFFHDKERSEKMRKAARDLCDACSGTVAKDTMLLLTNLLIPK